MEQLINVPEGLDGTTPQRRPAAYCAVSYWRPAEFIQTPLCSELSHNNLTSIDSIRFNIQSSRKVWGRQQTFCTYQTRSRLLQLALVMCYCAWLGMCHTDAV